MTSVEELAHPQKSRKKEFVGIVKSDRMDKTIVVAIETMKLHPLYKKYVKRLKKVKAHDEKKRCEDRRQGSCDRVPASQQGKTLEAC